MRIGHIYIDIDYIHIHSSVLEVNFVLPLRVSSFGFKKFSGKDDNAVDMFLVTALIIYLLLAWSQLLSRPQSRIIFGSDLWCNICAIFICCVLISFMSLF